MLYLRIQFIAMIFGICFTHSSLSAGIVLQDSSVINGKVIERNDSTITVENDYLGTIVIPKRYMLDRYARKADRNESSVSDNLVGEGSYLWSNEPNTNLVFVPTARTCRQGTFDFKDFELLFLTLSASPTHSTILSAGFLFPVTSDFQFYSFAVKQQLFSTSDGMFAAALMGQISKPVGMDDVSYFWNTFAVCSFQPSPALSLHGSLLFSGGERQEWVYDGWDDKSRYSTYTSVNYMVGAEIVTSTHTKLMFEFFDNLGVLDALGDGDDDEQVYFLNFALRLFWPSISVDIAGLRPIAPDVDFGSLLLIPFVNISYRFGGGR